MTTGYLFIQERWRDIARNLSVIDDHVRSDPHANTLFLKMLLHEREPHLLLRQLNESGVLGQFIPDFGKLVAQMQYDMYHIYTVDEHIIHTIGVLHDIERGKYKDELPLTSRIMKDITSRRILYLAMFLHDIAKGRGGNHTHLGEGIAKNLAKRLTYSDSEAEEVGWLVREHQFIPEIAFKRDLDDEKVIDDFVARVQSPERLRKLLAITVADMRSVGPGIWNGWKGELLRTLYHKAQQKMGAESAVPEQQRLNNFHTQMEACFHQWPARKKEHYFSVGFPAFWLSETCETHEHMADILKRVWDGDSFAYNYQQDAFNAITHVTVCMPYQKKMICHIAMAVAMIGANIVNARMFTLKDGTAVTRLGIQNRQQKMFGDNARLKRLGEWIEKALSDVLDRTMINAQEPSYKKSSDAIEVAPRVIIDNDISQNYSVIEINARDRVGLLYDIASTFSELGITISTAHISTYGEKVVDVFYVKDAFGLQIKHWVKMEQVRTLLTDAIDHT